MPISPRKPSRPSWATSSSPAATSSSRTRSRWRTWTFSALPTKRPVVPAKAGTQGKRRVLQFLDSRFRGNDDNGTGKSTTLLGARSQHPLHIAAENRGAPCRVEIGRGDRVARLCDRAEGRVAREHDVRGP